MTQPSAKRRERRKRAYDLLVLELRLLGGHTIPIAQPNNNHIANIKSAISLRRLAL